MFYNIVNDQQIEIISVFSSCIKTVGDVFVRFVVAVSVSICYGNPDSAIAMSMYFEIRVVVLVELLHFVSCPLQKQTSNISGISIISIFNCNAYSASGSE